MDTASPSSQPTDPFAWVAELRIEDAARAREHLATIWRSGATPDLLEMLQRRLPEQLRGIDDVDAVLESLSRFIAASRNPTSLLALFERDAGALPALLQVFATSQSLAKRLIADPESYDLLRASDGQPVKRRYLVDELVAELSGLTRASRAALAIRTFRAREHLRIAYGEFVRDLSPENVGRQLAYVADAVLEAALAFVLQQSARRQDYPRRVDGTTPEFVVLGMGNLGGEELSYGGRLELVFLCDQIDRKNVNHVRYYQRVVRELIELLGPGEPPSPGIEISLASHPGSDPDALVLSVDEALQCYESTSHTWRRLQFVKTRVVAGSQQLGQTFLNRLGPWIYRRFLTRTDLADVHALRQKLERRAEQPDVSGEDVVAAAGGRHDVELTVQFLQLLHGGDLVEVRCANTQDAIIALQRAGCLTHQEATLLSENYARLCRLQHQLAIMFPGSHGQLPSDPRSRQRLAWRLGIRTEDDSRGDPERFQALLRETFDINRRIINHLMIDAPHDSDPAAIETELLLDPEPDPAAVQATLSRYGFQDPLATMQDLDTLGSETVSFLSSHRCRHFFALLAPALLAEIARTPRPDETVATLVQVTDSLGAKATLWELLSTNRPTMQLMVRLCAVTPYLSEILVQNPGMIDELVDSLLIDRLPSAQRLDAQSIELCRGAEDIGPILHSFKNSAHLTIGVRDMLGKESVDAVHRALSDTAEACLRRLIEYEQEKLAEQFGDPVDARGEPAELVAVALGKFGGREPNYHSDLDVVFLHSGDGHTQRRVGGRRATTTNQHFFNQLAVNVIQRIHRLGPAGTLYELDSQMKPAGEEGLVVVSLDSFLRRFRHGLAPLWQRLALVKARVVSGSRPLRRRIDGAIADVLRGTVWHPRMAAEIRRLRLRMEQTTSPGNLKRGEGGTADGEMIAQMLTLRHAAGSELALRTSTTDSLSALAEAGALSEENALALIANYRTLRGIEANLRLMNTPARHELPEDDAAMQNLAFLMHENDPEAIAVASKQARQSNRRIFNAVFDEAER